MIEVNRQIKKLNMPFEQKSNRCHIWKGSASKVGQFIGNSVSGNVVTYILSSQIKLNKTIDDLLISENRGKFMEMAGNELLQFSTNFNCILYCSIL